jgi:hypothetical protein
MTLEDLARVIAVLHEDFARYRNKTERQLEFYRGLVAALLTARVGDLNWVTVREAAAIEQRLHGQGSISSVKAKIAAGKYHLYKRDGERGGRIPLEEILGESLELPKTFDWRR